MRVFPCLLRTNRKDIHELTDKVRAEMIFVWCETIEDLLAEALVDGHELVAPMRLLRPVVRRGGDDDGEQGDGPTSSPPQPDPPTAPPLHAMSKL